VGWAVKSVITHSLDSLAFAGWGGIRGMKNCLGSKNSGRKWAALCKNDDFRFKEIALECQDDVLVKGMADDLGPELRDWGEPRAN